MSQDEIASGVAAPSGLLGRLGKPRGNPRAHPVRPRPAIDCGSGPAR
jgi:hypothetical protein